MIAIGLRSMASTIAKAGCPGKHRLYRYAFLARQSWGLQPVRAPLFQRNRDRGDIIVLGVV